MCLMSLGEETAGVKQHPQKRWQGIKISFNGLVGVSHLKAAVRLSSKK